MRHRRLHDLGGASTVTGSPLVRMDRSRGVDDMILSCADGDIDRAGEPEARPLGPSRRIIATIGRGRG